MGTHSSNGKGPPYKSLANTWYTSSLFQEEWVETSSGGKSIDPVFSLMDEKPGLICARLTFLELNDPTGYKWSQIYLKSWPHFQRLMRCTWFREAYDLWIEEMNARNQCDALEAIRKIAVTPSQQQLAAAKYLAETGWIKNTKGRPSSEAIKGELKKHVQALAVEDEDLKRIGLKVIEGGKK